MRIQVSASSRNETENWSETGESRRLTRPTHALLLRHAFTDFCTDFEEKKPTVLQSNPEGHQHGGRKPKETSVTEFCYKSMNLFFEELVNSKVILFLIHKLFR